MRALTLPGAAEGLKFYLKPDLNNLMYDANGNFVLGQAVYAAMGQAFFTFSLGIGALAIFGSYIGKEHRLASEAVRIGVLDTFVALMSGLIIFPACFSFGVSPDSGPNLIFVTLPNIFNEMALGRLWGTLFFVFLTFAALSTVIAVFENIITFGMDRWGWSRRKAVAVNLIGILLLSMPCILGFNLWSSVQPLGPGSSIMDLEDFLDLRQYPAPGLAGLPAVLRVPQGLGLEGLHGRGQHRRRPALPGKGALLCHLDPALYYGAHFYCGLLEPLRLRHYGAVPLIENRNGQPQRLTPLRFELARKRPKAFSDKRIA